MLPTVRPAASGQVNADPPEPSFIVTNVNQIAVIVPLTLTGVPLSMAKSLISPIGVAPIFPLCQAIKVTPITAMRITTCRILEVFDPFFFGIQIPIAVYANLYKNYHTLKGKYKRQNTTSLSGSNGRF
ncbi:MAG: hypothetical protein ACTSSE_02505 [Candidatus Thorarchaeota archaeon]